MARQVTQSILLHVHRESHKGKQRNDAPLERRRPFHGVLGIAVGVEVDDIGVLLALTVEQRPPLIYRLGGHDCLTGAAIALGSVFLGGKEEK
jgi:hypothetical protein